MKHPVSSPLQRLFKFCQWGGFLLLANSLQGCGTLPHPGETNSPAAQAKLHPERTLNELLAHRLTLCSLDKSQRADQIKALRGKLQHLRKDDTASMEDELDGLLLTSCEPASTPGLQGEVLNHLLNLGQWPADYDNLFDLLRSQQRAISQYNARAQDSSRETQELRQALQSQKEEFNKLQSTYKEAIKGIGDIEETLDSRKQKRLPAP